MTGKELIELLQNSETPIGDNVIGWINNEYNKIIVLEKEREEYKKRGECKCTKPNCKDLKGNEWCNICFKVYKYGEL